MRWAVISSIEELKSSIMYPLTDHKILDERKEILTVNYYCKLLSCASLSAKFIRLLLLNGASTIDELDCTISSTEEINSVQLFIH